MNNTAFGTTITDRASLVSFAAGASAKPGVHADAMARMDTKVWPLGPQELASG